MKQFWFVPFSILLNLIFLTPFSMQAQCGIEIDVSGDTIMVCTGTSINLMAVGGTDHMWTPAGDFSDPDTSVTTLMATASQWYFVTGTVADSTCTDSVFVELFDPVFGISPSETDSVCQDDGLLVELQANGPISNVAWTPSGSIVELSPTTYHLLPNITTLYHVTASIGNCMLEDSIEIPVIPFTLDLSVGDTAFLCRDDSLRVDISLVPASANLSWTPNDSTLKWQPGETVAYLKPVVTTPYTVIAENGDCSDTINFLVRVDSLPDLTLNLVVEKPMYCAGEIVTIYSERADSIRFPDIMFEWTPDDGQIQDSTNTENVAIILQDTTLFRRITTNNACVDTSEITINVIPPSIPFSIMDTILCVGEMFQVHILDDEVDDLEWDPMDGLSCTSCPNPIVTAITSQTYSVTGEKEGCPVSGQLNVIIFPNDLINFGILEEPEYGQGEIITVTANIQPPPGPGTTFTWNINGSDIEDVAQTVMIPLNEIPVNTISVSWINSSGCPQTADTIITTIPPNIKVPNAFTPNGDELNDLFRPKNDSSAELIEFLVYNRWGQLVFEGDNADGWDGTFDGEAAPAEVYVYVMKFRFPNGNVETRKGDVTLIR